MLSLKKIALLIFILANLSFGLIAQTNNVVLIESFTETGCGFCAQQDSAYNALMKSKADKVAVINYHCFYKLDTFYQFNKASDERYLYYKLKGVPAALINGQYPVKNISFITYVTAALIDSFYAKPQNVNLEIKCSPDNRKGKHHTKIKVKATALRDIPSDSLRLFIVVTENNINHIERYKKKSVYGINEFDNIMRVLLTGTEGAFIGALKSGKSYSTNVVYTNDDIEINHKEVQIIAFIQDLTTGEVYGTAIKKEHPF